MIGFNLHNGLKALVGSITKRTTTANNVRFIGFVNVKRPSWRYNNVFLGLVLSIVILSGCYQATSIQNEGFEPLPSNTPFIMGHLEAAMDTMVNYPEILVGTVNTTIVQMVVQKWL